jgi:excinuclease ABC subunit B
LRLRATSVLLEGRRDVIIVASVSCIYSIGSPDEYERQILSIRVGDKIDRNEFLYKLMDIHYTRNDFEFTRGTFRARGDVVEIVPAYELEEAIRIEFFDDEVERISYVDRVTGKVIGRTDEAIIYPAKHFVTDRPTLERAIRSIQEELEERLSELRAQGKFLEAQRLEQRTRFDIEMMREIGYCKGIENYSRHLSGRKPGERPYTLLDYFPRDYLIIIDESHVTIPQLRGMYNGDRSRKLTLIEHGFRLPSALDNRPLKFEEFESLINQVIFVSATPGDYELEKCRGVVVEQIIRPTGLLDPEVEVRPIKDQIDDLIAEIRCRVKRRERVLVTTLTKQMAEDLCEFLQGIGIKVRYIHSDIDALERVEILRDLRLGDFDVLVGVNLLREGLDLPEVSLVAILDADKEGFLRSEKSLIQIAGRTARNVNGKVILYADRITKSMKSMIDETNRRRRIQMEYNEKHGIKPQTVYKTIEEILTTTVVADVKPKYEVRRTKISIVTDIGLKYLSPGQRRELIEQLRREMIRAAKDLEFERAAELRDEIQRLMNMEN